VKPTFLGIGAHKCASTWVYRVLQDHPEVHVSQPKELEYFSLNGDHPLDWYEAHFDNEAGAEVRGEISTTYFNWPDTPRRVRDYDPDLKLVLSLRDPVDRAFSHHLFSLQLGELPLEKIRFEDGLAAPDCDYLRKSGYAERIRAWLELFPREQLHVLFLEDIAKDPDAEAAKLYRHLGVDEAFSSANLRTRANQSYLPRSRSIKSLIHAGTAVAQKLGFADTLWKIRQTPAMSRLLDLNKTDIKRRVPPMEAATRAELQRHFADDVNETARLLDIDALPWETWRRANEARR